MLHIHIGHRFYGAGNIGDDWMLAGFLHAVERAGLDARLTCCTPHDREAMHLRFPHVEWLDGEAGVRERAISEATVWLGLGGTPFQTETGSWLLDQIDSDLALCLRYHTPAFFLGVGVEGEDAVRTPQTARIVRQARHIWTRDAFSAEMLQGVAGTGSRIAAAADLANIYFSSLPESRTGPADGRIGMVVNVEHAAHLNIAALSDFICLSNRDSVRWIEQEIRSLNFSEVFLWEKFAPATRARLTPARPDYHVDSLDSWIEFYDDLDVLLSTRYHSALAAAWRGSPVSIFARSGKLDGLIAQIGAGRCPGLTSRDALAEGCTRARVVSRETLGRLASAASGACSELFARLQADADAA